MNTNKPSDLLDGSLDQLLKREGQQHHTYDTSQLQQRIIQRASRLQQEQPTEDVSREHDFHTTGVRYQPSSLTPKRKWLVASLSRVFNPMVLATGLAVLIAIAMLWTPQYETAIRGDTIAPITRVENTGLETLGDNPTTLTQLDSSEPNFSSLDWQELVLLDEELAFAQM